MQTDWSVVLTFLPQLLAGAKITVQITIIGLVGGIILGTIAGLMRAYGGRILNAIAFTYIELIRGTPIVVQVMFLYFAMPVLTGLRVDPMSAAVVAIVVNAGAYMAGIVRGAFLSISKGLSESGLALGRPQWKVLVYILGPLAFRRLIPPLGNQFIVSLKDTSLFIVIGVGELTRTGQELMASNFRAVEIWTAVAVIYLILTGSMTVALRVIEKRMRIL